MNEKWKEVDERFDKMFPCKDISCDNNGTARDRENQPEQCQYCHEVRFPLKSFLHTEIELAVSKLHTDLDMEMAYKRGARELAVKAMSIHGSQFVASIVKQALASLESENKGEK